MQRESEELGERSPKRLVNFARVRDGESERYPTLLAGPLDGQSTSSSGAVTDAGHEPKGPELSTSAGKQNETPGSSRSDSFVLPVRTRREPRRYKVVKESSWSGLGVLRGSIEKRRQVPRSQPAGSSVAILTEKSLRGSRSPAKASKSAVELPVETPVEPKAEPGPATRRPNATAEEREWRAQNWTRNQPGENQPGEASVPRDKSVNSALTSTPEDHDSLRLAAELQKFAVEETSGGSLLPQTTAPSTTKMKYQPQRGAHRPQASNIASSSAGGKLEDLQHAARDVTMQDVSNLQSDDDWVVDTFIRQSEGIDASAVATSSSSTFQGATAGTGNYDVLVITQSDEETYGLMDEGRDEEDMDDSDDENGMYFGCFETNLSLSQSHFFSYTPRVIKLVQSFFLVSHVPVFYSCDKDVIAEC